LGKYRELFGIINGIIGEARIQVEQESRARSKPSAAKTMRSASEKAAAVNAVAKLWIFDRVENPMLLEPSSRFGLR
jgi:hypothetical protein